MEGGLVANVQIGDFSWERMLGAVADVKDRLQRACAALNSAGVPYAVAGGNAVAVWVARVDRAAVRATQDVDILIRREDFDSATAALESAGFVRRHAAGIDMFLDGPDAKARDSVHVVFAGEKVRPEYVCPAADVTDSEWTEDFRVLSLPALVTMKLTSNRDKDRTHIRDLIDVGLIDESWCDRLSPTLAERLRQILQTPEG